jgi:uncharacterized cupredoxin-like copper-binding protein
MRKIRIAMLSVVATAVLLAWAVPAMAAHSRQAGTTITVTAGKPTEFGFKLSKSSTAAGSVTFKVTNAGALPHDFKLCTKAVTSDSASSCTGKVTPVLAKGKSASLTVTLAKGSYEYLCTEPGHAASGMKGVLKVT